MSSVEHGVKMLLQTSERVENRRASRAIQLGSMRMAPESRAIPPSLRPYALFGVKAIHSLAFWAIQSAIFYSILKGLKGETDKQTAIAVAIATGETIIYVGNGFRCPLTKLAEDLGAERGSVTDIFLPTWLASNIARIYGPLFALGIFLHSRNILRRISKAKGIAGGLPDFA